MISVIMPVYNNIKYLRESIDSILAQIYDDFQFIILDDGSTEPVWDLLQSYDDPRMFNIKGDKNVGLTKCLNFCLHMAKGDFIARHDGDDISLPNRFAEQLKCFDDGVGLVTSYADAINEKGKKIPYRYLDFDSRNGKKDIKVANYIVGPTAIFRREVFDKIGHYDEVLYIAQDYNYWIRLLKYFDHIVVEKVLYKMRKHDKSVRTLHPELSKINWIKFCNERAEEWPIIIKKH